jgi:aminoglycoside phosphotransferase (APT) family kinase protein
MAGEVGEGPEVPSDAVVRAALARHLPHHEIRSLTVLGEGLDHRAYELDIDRDGDGVLIVRVAKDVDADAIRREADLLAAVSEVSPLPVPEPVFADLEAGVLAYTKLPGVPLLGHPVDDPVLLAPALGGFLSAVHQANGMERLAPRDREPLSVWRAEAEESYNQTFLATSTKRQSPPARGRTDTTIVNPRRPPVKGNHVLWKTAASPIPANYRRRVEAFLAAPPPDEPQLDAFCHNDLGAEHIVVDVEANAITGVIDWTDAAITDPMYDLALIYRDLGPEVFEATLLHYEGDCDRDRVLFYARCSVLEDIAYGVTTGARSYAEAGVAHLPWIFG